MKQHQPRPQANTQRRVLAGLLASGGIAAMLPASWTQPILRTVILPAHAQTTTGLPSPPPPEGETPVIARLNGVIDGDIGTEFTVDASASSGPDDVLLTFNFSANDACSVISQNGSTAIIRRNLIAGTCTVEVTVSGGGLQDSKSATASVTGAPPDPP